MIHSVDPRFSLYSHRDDHDFLIFVRLATIHKIRFDKTEVYIIIYSFCFRTIFLRLTSSCNYIIHYDLLYFVEVHANLDRPEYEN